MTDKIYAPWTPEQIDALNRFQTSGHTQHPFTCGRDHGISVVLIARADGWHCSDPACSYRQNWAHAIFAEPRSKWPAWLAAAKETLLEAEKRHRVEAAPTAQHWEQQRQRADQAEDLLRIAHETSNKSEAERARAVQRAERAEVAIARVRALHSNENGICGWCKGPDDPNISWDMEYWPCATLRASLSDPDAPAPEFGGSNGQWHWRCNGGQGCDGWVGVDLHSEDAAHREYARHFEQEHLAKPAPAAATQAIDGREH